MFRQPNAIMEQDYHFDYLTEPAFRLGHGGRGGDVAAELHGYVGPLWCSRMGNRVIRACRLALPDIESFGERRWVFSREEKSIWTVSGEMAVIKNFRPSLPETIGRGFDGTCAANG